MSGLISKKELLNKYNISYGTLYRWKRMGLIPDDWLVKKSTYTGQETFFDEEQICERIEAIIARKDQVPLEQIARELQGKTEHEAKLIINSKHWSKEINISDLVSVIVKIGSDERDLTEIISGNNTVINKSQEE